jgi:hypothetical protein
LMALMNPSPDVEDDDGERHAGSGWSGRQRWGENRQPPLGNRQVQPGTKESHSQSRSSSSKIQPGIPNTIESSSKRPVARVVQLCSCKSYALCPPRP